MTTSTTSTTSTTTESASTRYAGPPTEADVQAVVGRLPRSSFLAAFVRWCYVTSDTPLVFPLFCGLQALECVSGGLTVESFAERRATNLYVAVVGDSGSGRKTWVIERTRRVVLEGKIAAENPGVTWDAIERMTDRVQNGQEITPGYVGAGADDADGDGGGADVDDAKMSAKGRKKGRKKNRKKGRKKGEAGDVKPPLASGQRPRRGGRARGRSSGTDTAEEDSEAPVDMNPYGFLRRPATHQAVKWALSTITDPRRKSLVVYKEGDVFFSQIAEERRFRAFYMDAYDGGDLSDMTKGEAHRVILPSARLSLLVGATDAHIHEFMPSSAWLQGMAGRVLWAYGRAERRRAVWTPDPRSAALWQTARNALRILALNPPTEEGPVRFDEQTQRVFSDYEVTSGKALAGLESVVVSRRRQHAEKIACLLAMDARSKVTPAIARTATMIADLAVRGALTLYRECPNSKRDRQFGVVRRALEGLATLEVTPEGAVLLGRRRPVYTQAEVYRAVSRIERLGWAHLDEILQEMAHDGLVRFRPSYESPEKAHAKGLALHSKDRSDRVVWCGPRHRIVVTGAGAGAGADTGSSGTGPSGAAKPQAAQTAT